MIRSLVLVLALAAGGALAQTPAQLAREAALANPAAKAKLETLAESGDALAQHYLGQLYLRGRGVAQSETRAVEWFRRAAEQGDLPSAHNLGVIHERAGGPLADREEALRWYRFAAERGFAGSQANLGFMLSRDKDPEARQWIEKAAAQDNPRGLYLLGLLRSEAGDDAAAAALFRRAAEGGERDAQYRLALAYGAGRGVEKDDPLALQWLRRAAERGQAEAQYFLAAAHARGAHGVKHDDIAAAEWLKRSARQGNVDAQFALGIAYSEGRGVPVDPREALGWLRLAAQNGHAPAAAAVQRVEALAKKAAAGKKR